jgi:hypothetical protein
MTEDIFNEEELSENNTLYTDMVLELMSSWVSGSTDIVETVVKSISSEVGDNDTVMTGLLFGALLHIGILVSKLASSTGDEMDKVWSDYLLDYNSGIRKSMTQIPVLHPEIALKISKAMDWEN